MVAIIKFSGADKAATDIQKVVFDNLLRTGEFVIFDDEDLLSTPLIEEDIVFNDFRILDIDFLVMGKVRWRLNISVEYQVFDISKAKKLELQLFTAYPIKQTASSLCKDGIYQEITGIPGIASTKILYVTEANNFKLLISDADGNNEQVLLESQNQ